MFHGFVLENECVIYLKRSRQAIYLSATSKNKTISIPIKNF